MLDLSQMDTLTEFTYNESIDDDGLAQNWIDSLKLESIPDKTKIVKRYSLNTSDITRALENLKKNKNTLISILRKTIYSRISDCVESINTIINGFQNFIDIKADKCKSVSDKECRLTILGSHVILLGRILPSLINKNCPAFTALYLETEKQLLPFVDFLFVNVIKSDSSIERMSLTPERVSRLYLCPFVIFEDSDLDSAIDIALKSWWKYDGKVSWSVTNIYVHESVFNKVVSLIKTESRKKLDSSNKIGPSLIKELYNGNLEIYQPRQDCPHSLFIGWDPRDILDLENDAIELGVSILPFRNDNEIVSIINSKKSKFTITAASVWTEKFIRSSAISKRLNINTIWVNCHGIFNTSLDIGCNFKVTRCYLNNSSKCHTITFSLDHEILYASLPPPTTFFGMTNTSGQQNFQCSSYKEAVENATKASQILEKLKIKSPRFVFQSDNIVIEDDMKRLVIVWKRKKPYIYIYVEYVEKEFYDQVGSIVMEAIAHNCAVVLQVDIDSSIDINQYFANYSLENLPKGSLNIVSFNDVDCSQQTFKKTFQGDKYVIHVEDMFDCKVVYHG